MIAYIFNITVFIIFLVMAIFGTLYLNGYLNKKLREKGLPEMKAPNKWVLPNTIFLWIGSLITFFMEGFKTHRHASNPKEKEIHDKFVSEFVESPHGGGVALEQISLPVDGRGNPVEYLTDREKQIMISTIQWLGSPVGHGFLEKCGFEIKK